MNLVSEEDHLFITGCIKGDRNAQNGLYEKYSPKMLAVCFRYSKSREEAEDVLLEGFMKVFTNIQNFKSEGSFEGWIRKIMVNTALAKYRNKSGMLNAVNIEKVKINYLSSEDITSDVNAKDLIRMIQCLPPSYQMVFNLYAFEGMKHREIAQELGISEGTSKSNLSDARAILQRAVNNNFFVGQSVVNE